VAAPTATSPEDAWVLTELTVSEPDKAPPEDNVVAGASKAGAAVTAGVAGAVATLSTTGAAVAFCAPTPANVVGAFS
jgi:hypothetical protein